mmetsp:Transcript_19382/g.29737  ORF Transcript_19382/g.29737 Transcript_19382/m.29737 type:complete len:91 (+) Transcript_19382:537-809(+)
MIKSTFLNQISQSVFIVSILNSEGSSFLSKMECRSISLDNLRQGNTVGQQLFQNFTLQYPDFVEVDDLNRRVVTRHTEEKCFRVWDLKDY